MEFEQLSAFDHFSDVPELFQYTSLDNDGWIYPKIDWLTVIFTDCSMNTVLQWLRMDHCVSDFCAGFYEQSRGYDQVFKFRFNDVLLEASSFSFYGIDLSVAMFDVIVPKIRLELSGRGLDYLRSTGIIPEDHRYVVPIFPEGGSYHVTRCDWAFDFVNYKPEFVDRLIDHCNVNKLPSERIPLASTKGAISCRIVTGGQKTVYLGSPQSDSMLRCYDKRMEQLDLTSGVYKRQNPYNNPDSWFRIEWQTRNKLANKLFQDPYMDLKHILRLIFDRYAFADGQIDARNKARPVVDFWLDLFNWQEIESRIIQNAKYVQTEDLTAKLAKRVMLQGPRLFSFASMLFDRDSLERMINEWFAWLFSQDPQAQRSLMTYLAQLNQLLIENPDYQIADSREACSFGLYRFMGQLRFKL